MTTAAKHAADRPCATRPGRAIPLLAALLSLFGVGAADLPPQVLRLETGRGESRILALQIALDRRGFSCNTIDGQDGRKTRVALATYCAVKEIPLPPGGVRTAFDALFPNEPPLLTPVLVTEADRAACVRIPASAAEKAALPAMGYETLQEMFAERGHLTETALRRLNPGLAWPNPPPGSCVFLPDFRPRAGANPKRPDGTASVLRVSLSRFEVTAFDAEGRLIGLFPCSIAAEKNKLPPAGEICVKGIAPHPNYTYTPDFTPRGRKVERHIFPPGPNNPVGASWIGLSLPGYGIHGTPKPEQIGRAESHGCFRLANWNAVRLRRMLDEGVPVVIEP